MERITRKLELESAVLFDAGRVELSFGGMDSDQRGLAQTSFADLAVFELDGSPAKRLELLPGTSPFQSAIVVDPRRDSYRISFRGRTVIARPHWSYLDAAYRYEGPLGPEFLADGRTLFRIWAPLATRLNLCLYRADDPEKVLREFSMERGDKGVWSLRVPAELALGCGYLYRIDNGTGSFAPVLDPYAPVLRQVPGELPAQGLLVHPDNQGSVSSFAKIPGYSIPTDAVIWEVHVRDLTSDPSISDSLSNPFGTFAAFEERLDYIADLGVSHVQLLPVMAFLHGDRGRARSREMNYSSSGANYSWGYDPLSYFAPSGMYAQDEAGASRELKRLVESIHSKGMGVILDVVYNHTGSLRILEDLVPKYYHFVDRSGQARTSFGGGRLGSTHHMARRLLVDSLCHWTAEYRVDGFRFDMMGDLDAETVRQGVEAARRINPDLLVLGEGWRTYVGDEGDPRQAADQDWAKDSPKVAVFSDEFRDTLKSGFGNEGAPRFLTGLAQKANVLFQNLAANPGNFDAGQPDRVVNYIEAHDNLTFHDAICIACGLDPDNEQENREIHRRIRLGNLLVLCAQGIAFLHAGQEYGRTKQWRAPGVPEQKYRTSKKAGMRFPHFVDDSYSASDAINRFEWAKALDLGMFPTAVQTREYTRGLVHLRRSTDAFSLPSRSRILEAFRPLEAESTEVLSLGFSTISSTGYRYTVLCNADTKPQEYFLPPLGRPQVLVDRERAGHTALLHPEGIQFDGNRVRLDSLTGAVIRDRPERKEA